MASATIRISDQSQHALRELSKESGESMQAIVDKAIKEYQRQRFLEAVNADYAALRADPEAWAEHQKELALWDCTLMDGLDPNERWTPDGEAYFVVPEKASGDESAPG
jgi:predicted transcriptional regulator